MAPFMQIIIIIIGLDGWGLIPSGTKFSLLHSLQTGFLDNTPSYPI
jgi:hypothetical protein